MIIGITGTLGAGKGTIVDFLVKRGFKHYSVRDFISEEVKKRGMNVNRDSLVLVANDLRANNGSGYIVEEIYKKAVFFGGDIVIESIRTVGEVETLRKKKDFILFAVDADIEVRYSRLIERGAETDRISFEEFLVQERREMKSDDPTKQNLSKCIGMADHFFRNDWTMEELHKKVGSVLGNIGAKSEKYKRPTWDEYFVEVSRAVATRGTCDRGRSGCVIVRDKQILVTGYVGSPKGLSHCDEAGHQMEEWIHSDGVKRMHCVRTTHAEQNAICQAAKIGVSIEGATMYCKMMPCSICAGMIINSGIKRVVCEKLYHAGNKSQKLFRESGILVDVLNPEVEEYEGQ